MKYYLLLIVFMVLPTSFVEAENSECGVPDPSEESADRPSDKKGYVDVKKVVNTIKDHLTFNAYAQLGFDYNDKSNPRDQFKVARIIAFVTGQVTRDLSARVMFDVKNANLFEAWANYHISDALQVKLGQFKTPFSIENPYSPTTLELIGCASLVTNYMIGGSSALTMPGATGRDLGLSVYGELFGGHVTYDLAIMNGQGKNKSDGNSQKDFVARIGLVPVKGLTLSGSMIRGTGNVDAKLSEDGIHYVSTAGDIGGIHANGNFRRDRYSVGAELKTKPVNLRTEYMAGLEGHSHSKGYYATGSLNRIVGNLDVVASYDWLDTWEDRKQRYTAGVQYWFYPKCRAQLNYTYKKNGAAPDENSIQAQIQLAF